MAPCPWGCGEADAGMRRPPSAGLSPRRAAAPRSPGRRPAGPRRGCRPAHVARYRAPRAGAAGGAAARQRRQAFVQPGQPERQRLELRVQRRLALAERAELLAQAGPSSGGSRLASRPRSCAQFAMRPAARLQQLLQGAGRVGSTRRTRIASGASVPSAARATRKARPVAGAIPAAAARPKACRPSPIPAGARSARSCSATVVATTSSPSRSSTSPLRRRGGVPGPAKQMRGSWRCPTRPCDLGRPRRFGARARRLMRALRRGGAPR